MIDAAKIAKFQRQEQYQEYSADDEYDDQIIMASSVISSISNIKNSARYCIDLTTVLQVGEGVLVGSSASSLALIHGETILLNLFQLDLLESMLVHPTPIS